MKWGVTVLTVTLLIALVWVSGCADVSFGSQKVGDFGTSPEEKVAVDHFIGKYGDPRTNSGPSRFLEPLVTTGLVNNIPVNNVVKFSKATDKIYFWGFYDNFQNGDPLVVTWTHNGKTATSIQRAAGGDFGRVFGEFVQPDAGWPLGNHDITVTGRNTSETVTFEIVDGVTVTRELAFKPIGGYTWLNPQSEPPAPEKLAMSPLMNGTCQSSRDCPQDYACDNGVCVKEFLSGSVDKTTLKWGDSVTFYGEVHSNQLKTGLKTVCLKLFGPGLPGEGWRFANVSPGSDGQWKYTWDTSLPIYTGFQKQTGVYETRAYLGQCDGQDYLTFRLDFTASGMISCPTGQKKCGAGCVNILSDYLNCGDCGNICSPGFGSCCNGQCLNTWTDPSNCGSCGHACLQGQTCQNGQCVAPVTSSCPTGQKKCGAGCVNILSDYLNCGDCGNICSPGFGSCCNGQCLNRWTDPSNCGSCGHACLQGQTCQNGQCVQTCASGTTLCSGICVNTLTDINNCGFCGTKCSAIQFCQNGVCQATGGGIVKKTPTPTPTAIKIY